MIKQYHDAHEIAEDDRIDMIGRAAMTKVVAFMVDLDGEKGDRYLQKLREKYPQVAVYARFNGPVRDVETIKVGPGH